MRRSLILSQASAQVANVGDIAYKASNGKIMVVAPDAWDASLGTPVGVVVIPSGFAPDNGKARILSLFWVNENGVAVTSPYSIKWSYGTNDTSLINYTVIPITDNKGPNVTGYRSDGGRLPSDKNTGPISYVDPMAKYYNSEAGFYSPSPYLGDAPNPAYYAPISGYNNALSDFNGKGNTDVLVALGSSYTAANATRKYKVEGAEEIEWYLPAAGELGYLIARANMIQTSAIKVGGVNLNKSMRTSTESSGTNAWNGGIEGIPAISSSNKTYICYVRPFAQLDF